MAALRARAAIVDARKFAGYVVEIGLRKPVGVARQIEGPATQPRARLFRIGPRTIGMGEQRRYLELHDVGDDAAAFFPGIHDVEDVAALGPEPDDILGGTVALHDADIGTLVRLPGIGRLADHRALDAAGE